MEELQSLLEKINREGVEKAEAESSRIISEAEAKAEAILKEASEKAAKLLSDAEKDARAFVERASESVRQASRDTVLSLEQATLSMLENLLVKNVNAALADEKTACTLAAKAIESLGSDVEIAAAREIASSLKAQLAAMGEIKVVADGAVGSGFSVKIDGGRIEHSFTGEVIANELAKRLRPDLAALLK